MKSSSNLDNSEALTSFLILDHLEKAGVSLSVRNQLAQELGEKGLFQSLLTSEGKTAISSYQDLRSQIPTSKEPILRNIIYNQYQINKQRMHNKQEVNTLIAEVQQKFNVIDYKSRRKQLKRRRNSKRGYVPRMDYPVEIFTNYWNKYKSMFGHARKEQDPDDPINGSPVYNLMYDKSGRQVISAADDGIIKIWSTANGELVNSFIGHASDINAMTLSECGTYLASCSNDGIVRIWHLESGVPIAVFKDHAGVVCSLNFFSVPVYVKGERRLKRGLASASDDGTIKIYFEDDFVNNNGVFQRNQKHLTLKVESSAANKGFSSIEFHPEGFIAAGTNWGSIVIWDKLSELEKKSSDRDRGRIVKNEHSKDCHLTLWNKEGTMLLSASFDGTAKVWPWNSGNFDANRTMSSIFIFDGELGRGTDIKCCAVAWSARGRYAVASFCKKIGKRNEEVSLIQSNIQIYDAKMNKRSHKFDKTYDGAAFENYIFILEPHPFNESILISADYDGKIIIWDIERGVMLNCFIENCAHMSCPLIQAPILDGRFSPDGLSFCVANYYGSVTLYGYGEKDLFMTTPTEQFYSKEFREFEIDSQTLRVIALDGGLDMHLVEKGQLCSSKKRVYEPRPELEMEMETIPEFTIEGYYKKQLDAIDRLKYSGNQEPEGINSRDCVKALRARLHELAQQELEKVLENYYLENLKKRPSTFGIPGVPNFLEQHKDKIQLQIKKLTAREIEPAPPVQAVQPVVVQQAREPERENTMQVEEEEDYWAQGNLDRSSRARGRPRRTRRQRTRYNDEDYEEDEEDFIPETKEDDEDEEEENGMEEEEEEEAVEERQPRRLRKLVLDDGDEEPAEERRYATRRTENRNAAPGRRNRQIVNDTVHTREINTHHNLRGNTRARPQNFEEELGDDIECARCGLENARVKCSGTCGKVYHSACSQKHGRESEYGGFVCLSCLLKRRRSEKMKGAQVDRSWASSETPQKDIYVPQVGDLVTYVFQAHEDFILQYFEYLRFSKKEILPFEKRKFLFQDNVCCVSNIKYQFPLCPKKYHGHINILMKITLTVVETADIENIQEENKSFTFTYFPGEVGGFIFPRQMYLNSVNLALNLVKESTITVRVNGYNKTGQLSEIATREEEYPESHYGTLRVFDHSEEGGYSLRRTRRDNDNANLLYISPWDVVYEDEKRHDTLLFDKEISKEMTEEFYQRVKKDIEQLYEINDIRYQPFLEEVNKKQFTIYPSVIAFEMNIQAILTRLSHKYYRHKDAIISDINLIQLNCCKFNDKSALISILSIELSDRMTKIVQGTLDPEILAKPTDDDLLPLEDSKPAQFDQNPDLIQSLQQKPAEGDHGHENNIITLTKAHEEDHNANIAGMRLRPKRNVNFKNNDFGRDYDELDENLRRSTRVPHKKEDHDFVTFGHKSTTFSAEPPAHNSGYGTRLRTRRGDSLIPEDREERKENLSIVLPREVIKPQEIPKQTPEKDIDQGNNNKIKLRKAPTKTRSHQEKLAGESFIIEAIEGGNLGWKGLEDKAQQAQKPEVKPAAAAVETRNGRTRTSQRLNNQNGPSVVEETKEEAGRYSVRLRKPGKSFSQIYKEEQDEEFEDEVNDEEIDYAESGDEDEEVVFNKKQKKQLNKQNKRQQIREFNLTQQTHSNIEATESNAAPVEDTTRVTRAKRRITEHYKTSNINDEEEDPNEVSTKIRLTLPTADSGEGIAKRYNTRGQRR